MDTDYITGHKLCGFLHTVLTVSPPNHHVTPDDIINYIPLNTPVNIFNEGHDVIGFKSSDGVIFSLINPHSSLSSLVTDGKTPTPLSSRKRLNSRIGLVNGSMSVVHQLNALVLHKCLRIVARVVNVVVGGESDCEIRVVLLIDVYLPIALWSGWQFPRSKSIAAALFRHLSCDWEVRSSMLKRGKADQVQGNDIWDIPECHVIGCNQHCSAPDASKKKLFELHEIFKSLPSVLKKKDDATSRVFPVDVARTGIWMLPDDVLINILIALGPLDLLRVSSTCRHLRFLAATIMPCMNLKLFPHQQAAVQWMLQRERDSEVLPNPLYKPFVTEDGFSFYVNTISGEVVSGAIPTIKDFRGGMFCDEPGLGKTITTLSLILKTQGTWAEAPDGVEVVWCNHNGDHKCGYYELNTKTVNNGCWSSSKKVVGRAGQRGLLSLDRLNPKEDLGRASLKRANAPIGANSTPTTFVIQCDRRWTRVKRNLLHEYEEASYSGEETVGDRSSKRKHLSVGAGQNSLAKTRKRPRKATMNHSEINETWVQCDACRKWRRLVDPAIAEISTAWFCSMNNDPLHRNCAVSEESWDYRQSITHLPGFYTKGTSAGREENVSFFIGVLKDNYPLMHSGTKKALTWLAKLSPDKLSQMETTGLLSCLSVTRSRYNQKAHDFHRIFQAFGLTKRVEKGTTRWYYPKNLVNLVFDLCALRIALCEPLDSFRLYLSKATLVVVPSNLIDHWKTQIQRHVRPGQLRVYVWTDHKKPSVHNLAWDYDIVITTFSRLSAEWGPHKTSALMQVHWLRLIFDEGHTLGSSVNLTNKLQMSVSLTASSRWLLTGTPTPNTPNSQLSHLHPMLKFLREEAYGQNQSSWDSGILRPFEAEMEEGRARLLQLLHRCMISARKCDLQMIPPCIKKVTFLDFNEEHARSYNELVVTVLRNILMADWKDPSHVESLLNPKQWKFRSSTIRNVRLSCCVAGQIKVTDAGQDIQETMDLLVEGGLDPMSVEYAFIKYNLQHGGNCMRCQEWCRLPVITPCRHLLCLDCVSLDSERCTFPGCDNLYEMQSPETLARPENPNPKWPVPKDLIELQPSYKQDDWHPDWQSTSSSKVSYLVVRLKELQRANRTILEGNDADIDHLLLPVQKSEASARPRNESSTVLLEKVLIFSQFLEHIHVIEQQLTMADIKFSGMYSPMHASNKMKSLAAFQHDAECVALVMDGSAALGLDLSFVTHVFLMEPIWDKSMEEQVISRAHRMGATRPIHVETLAMRGTIEEQMLKFLQNADECRRFLKEESGRHEHEGTRVNRTLHDFAESNYLAELRFARTISDRKEPY